jgi:hypothetical protein
MIKSWDEFINEEESNLSDSNSQIIAEGSSDDSSYMALANLKKIHHMVGEIINKMPQGYIMDRWAEDHIATSADDLDEVYSYLMYGENFDDSSSPTPSPASSPAPSITAVEIAPASTEEISIDNEESDEKEEIEDEIEDEVGEEDEEMEEEEEMNEE